MYTKTTNLPTTHVVTLNDMLSASRFSRYKCPRLLFPHLSQKTTLMDFRSPTPHNCSFLSSPSFSPPTSGAHRVNCGDATVGLREWQGWGTDSPVPAMVSEVIEDYKVLLKETDSVMTFGGNHGKLQGNFKVNEDKKHRAKYKSLDDSEKKLQFFSARQVACRILGSRGYLCQKCWLPLEDCMCSKVKPCSLWHEMRFWLYMHPKDFLRQNNTGKLLWQVFGMHAATLCIYGIAEHEEIMWNEFKRAGKNNIWCLYPNKNAVTKSVQDAFAQGSSAGLDFSSTMSNRGETINFVLIDGTWSNSGAMFKRLKEQANVLWAEDIACISLNAGASAMHKLRPQPSWDRTCTAAAAVGLLSELQLVPEFSSCELVDQAEAVEDALEVLLEALTARRLRMGRSISRSERRNGNFC